MSIVLFLIFMLIALVALYIDDDAAIFVGLFVIASIIFVAVCICHVVNGRAIDAKIAMYQEENKAIESQLDVIVEKYMDYESKTLGELKGESSITLVSLYPELKADELVKQQVKVYTSNNKKIKALKEEKINISIWKWWLYFGG